MTSKQLTGAQRKEIHTALARAFDWGALDQMLTFECEQELAGMVARSDSGDEVVLKVIRKAEEGGWLSRLLRAAATCRPDNPTVQQLARKYGGAAYPEAGPLLPYECDRTNQKIRLSAALQQLKQTAQRRPLVCVVHGEPVQCHEEFIDLLAQRLLLDGLELARDVKVQRYSPDWPSAAHPREVGVKFWEKLAYKIAPTLPSVEAIARRFNTKRQPILIDVTLATDTWLGGVPVLLEAFLRWWADWPPLDPGLWLVVCLKVKYQDYRYGLFHMNVIRSFRLRRANGEMRRFLEAAEGQCPNGVGLVVLPELAGVDLEEALTWRSAVREAKHCGERNLTPDIEALFDHPRYRFPGKMPMRELAGGLNRLLENC